MGRHLAVVVVTQLISEKTARSSNSHPTTLEILFGPAGHWVPIQAWGQKCIYFINLDVQL